jgi:thioredoxin-related protein
MRVIAIFIILLSFFDVADGGSPKIPERADSSFTLLIFTGSDWCTNCMRLEKNVLSDSLFRRYIAGKIVVRRVDFPQRKKPDKSTSEENRKMAETYHFRGIYPTILLLDADCRSIGEIIYANQTPADFIGEIENIIRGKR